MKTVAFHTLGCKVNQYETEAMEELFVKAGYKVVNFNEDSDIYVINTCTVTNMADKKSRQIISRAKKRNEKAIIAVVGCYAQIAPEKISQIQGINLIIGTDKKNEIVNLIEKKCLENQQINVVENIKNITEFESLNIKDNAGKTRAYVKIQDGCNQYCSYCIIPYTRGSVRSRKPQEVIKEVEDLVLNGYKEIILTGIHIASYGKELNNFGLLDIIKEVHSIGNLERIRLSSLEPNTITKEFVESAKKMEKLCPHFHLSLQSGCDDTLKEMNRKYTTDLYRQKVQMLRENIKDVAITTDIIVGFPGETEEDFNDSYDFVKEIGFSEIHVFKYSKREGTPAAKRKDQIEGSIKEGRSKKMIDLGIHMQKKYIENYIGTTKDVLFEKYIDNEQAYEGYTDNYIRVLVKSEESIENKIKSTKIEKIKMIQEAVISSIGSIN